MNATIWVLLVISYMGTLMLAYILGFSAGKRYAFELTHKMLQELNEKVKAFLPLKPSGTKRKTSHGQPTADGGQPQK